VSHCVGFTPLTEGLLKPGVVLRTPPDMADFCENARRKMYRVWTPNLAGVWIPQVHGPCAHNLVRGLLIRTLGPTPSPTKHGLERLERVFRETRRVLRGRIGVVDAWDLNRVVASYKGARLRVRYEEALRSLAADGLCTRFDSKVKAFVKGEKLPRYKVHKPRVIMGRSPRYNLELAAYLKPVEHAVYGALRGWGSSFLTHTRLIGKGLSLKDRASLIRRKMHSVPGVVAMELDCASFESHFSLPVLRLEHSIYTALCRDGRLKTLLGWQERFSGSGCGVEYEVTGVRASGDFNTGLGNTVVMCCLVLSAAKALGLRFDFLADGDNAVLFVLERDVDVWVSRLPGLFLEAGFEVTLEEPVRELEKVVFGQSKPCFADGAWTMVRDPFKVLSHAACGFKHYADMRGGLRVLKSVAYCEAVLSQGIPVLQEFAHSLLAATRNVSFCQAELDDYQQRKVLSQGIDWSRAVKREITLEARVSFEKSWGISIDNQISFERKLSEGFTPPSQWDVPLETEIPDGRDLATLTALGDFASCFMDSK